MTKIILATSSPYRINAFKNLGYEFKSQASNIEEKFANRPKGPVTLVELLSRLKAEDVAKNYNEGLIIGFDSVGYHNHTKNHDIEIMEKPQSKEEAFDRLMTLSGKGYNFVTDIHMIRKYSGIENPRILKDSVKTIARLRELDPLEVREYLESTDKYKTYAQGFDPLNRLSSTFIKKIEGSYHNILQGIPLERIKEMIIEITK